MKLAAQPQTRTARLANSIDVRGAGDEPWIDGSNNPSYDPVMRVKTSHLGAIMSRSVNKVLLVGHLGRDAETVFTSGGIAVTKFSIATTHRWKDQYSDEWKEETNWTSVVLWRSENLATYLTKGQQILVEGRLHNYCYEDREGRRIFVSEVVADEIILLGSNGSNKERVPAMAPAPGRPELASRKAARQ